MCVTNTTFRRTQPVTLPPTAAQDAKVSGLTQRLMGTFQLASASNNKPQQPTQPTQQANAFGYFPTQTQACAPAAFQPPLSASCVAPMVPQLATTNGKPRPKRRRKPQKPGKTAKMNDRHFVVHNYHDHGADTESDTDEHSQTSGEMEQAQHRKGGVAIAFPLKLHAILDQVERDGLAHVISWQPHGRCFVIHQPKVFVESVMPKYFRQTKLTSFQRQLNLYGFCRLTRGNDAGGYYHELFFFFFSFLTKKMIRTKVKGTKFKAASSPDQEPDFYRMPPISVTPSTSPVATSLHAQDDSISEAPCPGGGMPFYNQQLSTVSFQGNPPQNVMEPYPFRPQVSPPPPTADDVLDQAVNELFLDSSPNMEIGDLDDFVRDWDPNNSLATALESDVQLGYMLDRLLED